ncbi:hypothetical protein [Flexibacterium corallicola]|uniref:hypothetical protein n=1 Tax=Flexibacterium corallicola TaxID=3037259 RepID=UPI00286EBAB6|nr:hypothetical protein [Pseudovibrio sp. M1P-2-3]
MGNPHCNLPKVKDAPAPAVAEGVLGGAILIAVSGVAVLRRRRSNLYYPKLLQTTSA